MNKILTTTLIVIAVLALAVSVFFAGSMFAHAYSYGPSMMFNNSWNNDKAYVSGPINSNRGYGMMGSGRSGYGMMGGYGWKNGTNYNATPLSVPQAKQAAENYIQSLNIADLEIAEVMIFDNNAYVSVKESDTGLGAFELLVDPASQVAYPEYGPNMMWNLKYSGMNHGGRMNRGGMMGGQGMMNGWSYQDTVPDNGDTEMTVTPEQAVKYAQQYLNSNYAGATAATDPMQFYGYYTLDFEKDGKIVGMLSINGYNGQIFLHTWHGSFMEESK
jgi:hypothetical protein